MSATLESGSAKSRKVAISAVVVALVLGGLIAAAKPKPDTTQTAPQAQPPAPVHRILGAKESNFDFGTVSMAAGKVTHRYWIRNTDTSPITIKRLYTSCMCTTAALVKANRKYDPYGMPGHGFMPTINAPMAPGESAMVEVVFDPAAHGPAGIGPVDRFVTLQTDREPPLELAFTATVTP
jgi:hypothetical protein